MEQGSVKHVGVVSGSEHDHTDVAIEAGHLREQGYDGQSFQSQHRTRESCRGVLVEPYTS